MVHIRPAAREDLNTLFALDQVCFREGIAYSKAELRYFLFHPYAISLIAEDENGIAGFAIAEMRMQKGRREGHIVTIDVDPARRRQGVGRVLMTALMERCSEGGAALLRLEVAVDNAGAIAFYRLLGFVETGRIPWLLHGTAGRSDHGIELHTMITGRFNTVATCAFE